MPPATRYGAGKNFGPELSGIGSRDNAATILQSILQPNARLVEGYRTHIVEMKDGKTYAGMALEESGLTFNQASPPAKVSR